MTAATKRKKAKKEEFLIVVADCFHGPLSQLLSI